MTNSTTDVASNQQLEPCYCGADAVLRYEGLGVDAAFDHQPFGRISCSEGRSRCCPELQFEPNADSEAKAINEWNAFHSRININKNALIEALAALAHEQWAGWMRYVFEKAQILDKETDAATGHEPNAARWQRQMRSSYLELPETEKESDRKEAQRMIEVFRSCSRVSDGGVVATVDDADDLHLAICQAVHLMNQGDLHAGHDLLRQTLVDFADKKAPLSRTEIIRQQQRSGAGEVSAIMVSPEPRICVLCGHAGKLNSNGVCVRLNAVKVEICGCICEFATASPAAPKEEAPLIFKRTGGLSRCCNSPLTWSHDGPICDQCGKWAVTQ